MYSRRLLVLCQFCFVQSLINSSEKYLIKDHLKKKCLTQSCFRRGTGEDRNPREWGCGGGGDYT